MADVIDLSAAKARRRDAARKWEKAPDATVTATAEVDAGRVVVVIDTSEMEVAIGIPPIKARMLLDQLARAVVAVERHARGK